MQALLAKPSVRLKSCSAVIYNRDKGTVREYNIISKN